MIAIKTSMFDLPEYCDCCRYYQCSPHPTKGWSDVCGLCYECMDDECKEGWLYDGNSRPEKCPLFIVPEERTCRMEKRRGGWYCTECNELVGVVDTDSELFIDGNAIVLWSYCPNCGARVKEDE